MGEPYKYNESLDKFTIKLKGLDEDNIRSGIALARNEGGSIDFSKYNTLTIGMSIKKTLYADAYWIMIYCGTSNIHNFYIESGSPKERIISETLDISHINIEGRLSVEITYGNSDTKYLDSYEIYELELK